MEEKIKQQNNEANPIQKKRKRNIVVAGFISLLTDTSSEMIYALIPGFLMGIGVGREFIGLIEGIAESTASILKGVSGWLSDKFGKRKPLIASGYGISNLSKPFFYFVFCGWHVLLLRFIDRFGKGVRTAARDALVSESAPAKKTGRAFGLHRALDQSGAVIGPLLGYLLLYYGLNCRQVFLVSVIPGGIAVLIAVFLLCETGRKQNKKEISTVKMIFTRQYKLLLASTILFTLGNASNMFLIIRAKDIGITHSSDHLLLWALFNGVYALTAYPIGRLSDKLGRLRIIVYSFICYSIIYIAFGAVNNIEYIWILFALYGVYHGASDGVLRAYVSDITSPDIKATAYGIYHTAVGLCAFFASLIFGILYETFGAEIAFNTSALLALLAIFPLLLSGKKAAAD
ncbi:MAG: MFS transporter [Planctomycetota bacterium]